MLSVKGLESGYGEMQVLWGVDIEVAKKSVTTVIGPNGAGKTTTLKSIFGIVRPWSGSVEFNGTDVTHTPPHKKVEMGITMVLEGRHLFPNMTVEENLTLGAYTKRGEEAMKDTLELVYSLFPILKERSKQKAGTLSGGEQQMLAIARALMLEPKLLLLDEPSMGLAPIVVDTIAETIARIKDELGISILLVEQNLHLAFEVAERGYVLVSGEIVRVGHIQELKEIGEEYFS